MTTLSTILLFQRLGVKLPINDEVKNDEQIKLIINEALCIYDESSSDPVLNRASYGLAVCGASAALNVTLRTAALLFENAVILRSLRHDITSEAGEAKPKTVEVTATATVKVPPP